MLADVDGTLVGASGAPTERVARAAAAAIADGVAVGFATGRMRLAVTTLHEQLQLPGPHVLHNGAEVRAGGRTVASWPLARGGVATVLQVAKQQDLYVELYLDDRYVVSRLDERARPHWDILGLEPAGTIAAAEELDEPVLKATFALFDPADLAPLLARLEKAGLAAGPAGSPMTPDLIYVNATDPQVDKGRAIKVAAEHVGVPLAATVVVGDAANDLPMLALAGTAVAMGQAEPPVAAAAHLVVPDVDADGVADALDFVVSWRRAQAS